MGGGGGSIIPKEIKQAVDDTKNAIGGASDFVTRGAEDLIKGAGKKLDEVGVGLNNNTIKAANWAERRGKEIENDPTRAALAIGTLGGSEILRTGVEEVAVQAQIAEDRDAPKVDAPPPAAPPKSDTPAEAPPVTEESKRRRAARGRASTILSGARGLTGGASTSRRTLLGV